MELSSSFFLPYFELIDPSYIRLMEYNKNHAILYFAIAGIIELFSLYILAKTLQQQKKYKKSKTLST